MTTWIDIDPQGLMRVTQERERGTVTWRVWMTIEDGAIHDVALDELGNGLSGLGEILEKYGKLKDAEVVDRRPQ